MKKRILCLTLALITVVSLITGCGKSSKEPSASTSSSGTSSGDTSSDSSKASGGNSAEISIFINSPEYLDAMNALISEYKKEKPDVKINLEAIQSDYSKMLKEKISSGKIPDVFASKAGAEIKEYEKYSYDLTDQPLAKAMTDEVRSDMSYKGKVYGFPIQENAYGIVYNKDIFDKNKISAPTTLTELEAAAQKLKSIGIQPFTTGYKELWVFKNVFMHFFDASQPLDVEGLTEKFISGEGKFDNYPIINDNFFKFIDMTLKYGDIKPLDTDLSAQTAEFATGKAAMMVGQGPWVEESIVKISPDMKLGFTGYPVSDKSADAFIAAGADQAIRISKDSKSLGNVLNLFNWLYTSDYGKKWFSGVAKVIPPMKDAAMPKMQLAKEFETYRKSSTVGKLYINLLPETFHVKFGEIMKDYIAKTYTKEQAIKEIEKAWKGLGTAKK